MPGLITPLLEQARQALADQRLAQALPVLLRAWSAVRNPALAELIEQLSARVAADRPGLSGTTRTEVEASWRARAETADAIELGVLLPSLADADSHQARKRLKLIARHAPDPRVATALTSIVLSPPFTASSTAKFWQTLHELLCACPDPRALARLEQAPPLEPGAASHIARLDARRRRSVESLRAQLDALPIDLEDDDLARVEALTASLAELEAAQRDLGPELHAAIVEVPAELERRAVYADYLLSIGDPRGEFIALQLAGGRGELDRAGKARVKQLLHEHQLAWLGSVGRALVRSHTRFGNGFLSAARIKLNHRGLADLLDDPIWATVESLELAPLELVRAPIMRSLRSLGWTAYQVIAASREQVALPGITALFVEGPTSWSAADPTDARLRAAIEDPELFPDLRRLSLEVAATTSYEHLAGLWAGPLGERLDELELNLQGSGPRLGDWLRSLRARPSEQGLTRLCIKQAALSCWFERSGGGWSRVHLNQGSPPAAAKDFEAELRSLRALGDVELHLLPATRSSG